MHSANRIMSDGYIAGIGPSDRKTSLRDLPQDNASSRSAKALGRTRPTEGHSNSLLRVNICGLREVWNVFDGLWRLWSKALGPRSVCDHGQLVGKVAEFLQAVGGHQEISLPQEISQRSGRDPFGRNDHAGLPRKAFG